MSIQKQKGRVSAEQRVLYWEGLLELFNRSELSGQAFCKQQGIAVATFNGWKKRLREAKAAEEGSRGEDLVTLPVLLPKMRGKVQRKEDWEVNGAPKGKFPHSHQSIVIGGMELGFSAHAAPEWIAAVIAALSRQQGGRTC
ncbi:hypothetical protein WDW86_20115 [Bdellovibrionota bacterium FG-2]